MEGGSPEILPSPKARGRGLLLQEMLKTKYTETEEVYIHYAHGRTDGRVCGPGAE